MLYGIPAAVVLSQYALESTFGLSDIGARNYFGHKYQVMRRYGPQPARFVLARTKEFLRGEWKDTTDRFAKYSSVADCFFTHGKFLATSPLYKRVLRHGNDPISCVKEIGRVYATDRSYSAKLVTIMRRYNLIED